MKELPRKDLMILLNKIGAGDNKAIEIIYRHYQAAMFAFIRLRVRDDAAAEEILNDTFMIAFSKPAQYNANSTYMTWLCGIAKNVCGTWMRKQNAVVVRAMVHVDDDELEGLPDPDWNVLSQLESREMDEIIHACIDRLPVAHREAFFWTWFEDEPMERVAERLDCPIGTIKSRLFNARAKISDCVRNAVGGAQAYV